jgi:stage V sporulation protein G
VEITEVRIKLMEDNSGSNERLQAFCSITFDDMFVIRDLKIIEGTKGFFVAMPSRKLSDRCGHCGTKNHLRSRFCNQCGSRLDEARAIRDAEGRAKLHADIAHPINSSCREMLQAAVLATYADELERSKLPGYVSRYDDFDDGDWDNAMPIPGSYANYPGQQAQNNPYGNAPFRGTNQAGPPLRRGPLRPHTQHNQPYAPVYRGPHAPRRHPDGEHVVHQENDGYNSHPSDGYGGR